MAANDLSSELPSELFELQQLEEIDLSDNSITGTLPLELASLSQLVHLDLDRNNFIGPVPPELPTTLGEFLFITVSSHLPYLICN
jgi:Leucine-rich repeat (LRR) protein